MAEKYEPSESEIQYHAEHSANVQETGIPFDDCEVCYSDPVLAAAGRREQVAISSFNIEAERRAEREVFPHGVSDEDRQEYYPGSYDTDTQRTEGS